MGLDRERVIFLVDLDYFYAQCEERRNLDYKNKPVVVCIYTARGEDSGAVSTANYIARRFGVKAGISISLAKRLLKGKEAVFIPADRDFYADVSNRVMSIIRNYADDFEQVSIDEAYLDVSKKVQRDFVLAEKLAKEVKGAILARERLTCSIGVGPNKLMAKIAAGHNKPDGLTLVRPSEVKSFLFSLPVDKLPGVGEKTEKSMFSLNVKTIGDLANWRLEELIKTFGRTLGLYFHQASNGVDDTPVQEREMAEQISRITTLKEDTQDINIISNTIGGLCEKIQATASSRKLFFRSVGLIFVTENLGVHNRSKTLETATGDFNTVKGVLKELSENFLREEPNTKIRRIGVKISNLEEHTQQKNLSDFL